MMENGDIPEIPVFVDSPLAIRASQVFREHPECFDEETRQFIANDKHHAALGFDRLKYTLSVEESKAINFTKPPYVVISASGMAETGRILHHLKNHIEDARNTILIVSWQAPHTLGRRLADQRKGNQDLWREIFPSGGSSHYQWFLCPCRAGWTAGLR